MSIGRFEVKSGARRAVQLIALIVGLLGFPPLLYALFREMADPQTKAFLKHSPLFWTVATCVAILGLLLTGFLTWAVRLLLKREDIQLGEIEKLKILLTSGSSQRRLQGDGFRAMSLVYGYHIKRMKITYEIYAEANRANELGEGTAFQEIDFVCGASRLRSWSRTVGSTLWSREKADLPSTSEQLMENGHKVTTDRQEVLLPSGGQIIDVFGFEPPIAAGSGSRLSFRTDLPKGTFLAFAPNSRDRKMDWVTFTAREPIEQLEIQLNFHDFTPKNFSCRALYNPAQFDLEQESFSSRGLLDPSRKDGKISANLRLPYPVIGVTYKIEWELPTKTT